MVKHRPSKGQGHRSDKANIVNKINEVPKRAMGTSRAYIEQRLQAEFPDWTQQRIADEVGVSRQYVTEVASKTSESEKSLAIPAHINGNADRADFRKLPDELREKVVAQSDPLPSKKHVAREARAAQRETVPEQQQGKRETSTHDEAKLSDRTAKNLRAINRAPDCALTPYQSRNCVPTPFLNILLSCLAVRLAY